MEKQFYGILLLLLFGSTAFGQSDTSKTLSEVEVRGSTPTLQQGAHPAQQISASAFKNIGAYNVADAVRNFSGVNIKDYGGIGGLKTVSVRSLGANHTGLQFDGVQSTDAQNGQIDLGRINLENVASITLYNGQSPELLQPARAYASASLLVIKSLEPAFEGTKKQRLNLSLKTGSFGLFHPGILWQRKLSERWSLNVNSSLQQANGKYKYKVEGDGSDTLATRNNAGLRTILADAAVYWKGADSNRFQFRINYNNSSRGLPGAVVYYNPYSNQHLWNKDLFAQGSYTQHFRNKLQLLLNAKFSNNVVRYLDPDYLNSAGELDQHFRQMELYESATLSYPVSDILTFALASDLAYNKLKTNLYNYAYPSRITLLNALAAKLRSGKLSVQASLLNTTISERVKNGHASPSKSIWSPTISLSYQPLDEEDLQFRFFYKDVFRNPTFNDLYYTRSGTRDLRPEYAIQYNAGVTYGKVFSGLLQQLTLSADAYYNKVKDKIIAIPNKDLFTWTMLNLGLVDIRGLDLGIKTRHALSRKHELVLSVNYTYQKALDITTPGSSVYMNQIPYTPEHTFAFNAGISSSKTGIYYNHVFASARYYLGENLPAYYVPGFSVSDLSLNHQLYGKLPIQIAVAINNLFNQSYAFIRSFPMPGRSMRLSFQITI